MMNTRKRWIGFAAALVATFAVAATFEACAGVGRPVAPAQAGDKRFSLRLVPGPDYKATTFWYVFPVPIYPQVACWLETPEGAYVDTIYVTAKGATRGWIAAPAAGRPEALPVWTAITGRSGAPVDAVSSPTPSGITARDSRLGARLTPGNYVVKLEVNRSYDYNAGYTRANAGVTGQPSLVYACSIEVGGKTSRGVFRPIGTGSVDGSDGEIHPGLDGITTALSLLSEAEVTYEGSAE